MVRLRVSFKFSWAATIPLEWLTVLGAVDSQCDKLVMVIGHQFITLTVDIDTHLRSVQHGGAEAPRRACLTAAVETCSVLSQKDWLCIMSPEWPILCWVGHTRTHQELR